jgi:3-methylcrotonyl-CoA carboxylase beta subunit
VDHLADNDAHALAMAREIVGALHHCPTAWLEQQQACDPAYPCDQIYGIVPRDLRQPYDVREVIARLVDGSDFHEFKSLYGKTLVCGFASLWGYPVAILANNGILFSESALKGAHFVQLANRRRVPLLFLQNITGFMVGKRYENAGIARDGAKMVTAVACSTVPKLTVVIGGSFGAGNYAMCGKAFDPRLIYAWPTARCAVMGGEQATDTLLDITLKSLERQGEKPDDAELEALAQRVKADYDRQMDVRYAAARGWVDRIIDPARTREELIAALEIVTRHAEREPFRLGVFQV